MWVNPGENTVSQDGGSGIRRNGVSELESISVEEQDSVISRINMNVIYFLGIIK